MERSTGQPARERFLMRAGMVLFLLGLITGLAVPALANPRLGLSSHLEGLLNGMFLVLLGLLWPHLRLSSGAEAAAYRLALFGTYTNWATTLAAAFLGAGEKLMPIAAAGRAGTPLQEALIAAGLVSLSVAILVCGILVLWGLRGGEPAGTD